MFYSAYRVGAWLIRQPAEPLNFQFSLSWLMDKIGDIWLPLVVGSLFLGVLSATTGWLAANLLWRWHVIRCWRERRRERLERKRMRRSATPATSPAVAGKTTAPSA
jgi:uncharacterized protein (DUF2062 family)